MNFLKQKKKWIFFGLLSIVSGVFTLGNSFLTADFLDSETSIVPTESDDFFLPDYIAVPEQVGDVVVSVNTEVSGVLGFEMEIEYDEELFSFEGFSTVGTALEEKSFFIQENINVPGVLKIVGATGGEGANFKKGDRVLFLTFRAGNKGDEDGVSLMKFTEMKIIGGDLEEKEYTTATGKIYITESANPDEETEEYPRLYTVEPYRVIREVTETVTLRGEFSPPNFEIYADTYPLEVLSVSEDKTLATLKVPSDILKNTYPIEMRWGPSENREILSLTDAFIVEDANNDEITVISEKSYASPKKIPNDNATTTTLFVYTDDTRGLADLEKVTADLRIIDGEAAVALQKGAIENGTQLWKLENITVPETVSTKSSAYQIPIIAQNKSGIHAEGFVSLWVTKDTTSSIPPVIKDFSITPNIATPADTDHPLLIKAEIKDEDGGEDITTVAVDLSPVQLNTIFLVSRNQGQETSKTRFFENGQDIVIPESVADGKYEIILTAIDEQGEESKKSFVLTVQRNSNMGPRMESGDSYVTPANELIRDGKFSFQIHTKVTDPSGADNIQSVSANLSGLGLPPVLLTGGVIEGRSQWYSSESLILPSTATIGKRIIEITATDKEGNVSYEDIPVTVGVQSYEGRPPLIESEQNYITPPESINDGETTFAAYVLVNDLDDDISHVILKLGNTALFAGQELPKGTSSKDSNGVEKCISTRTLLCMQPIMKESTGQWYYISDLVISKTTLPKDTPYQLEILAVDQSGKTGSGYINIPVKTKTTVLTDRENTVSVVQPISPTEIQVLFKNPIEPSKIHKDLFKLSSSTNKNDQLGISSLSVSPDGKIITIYSEEQQEKGNYSLTVNTKELGIETSSVTEKVFPFEGFFIPKKETPFKVTAVKSNTPNTISLTFSHPLNAESIINTEHIEIFKEGSRESLSVRSLSLSDNKTIVITTDTQGPGATYNIFYKNIISAYGSSIEKKKSTKVEAYKAPLGESLSNLQGTADFNGDGLVDFKDFTLFAAVYGKTYEQAEQGDINGDNTIDFSDFTLFSAQYGEVLGASEGEGSKTEETFHGSASSPSTGNQDTQSSGIADSPSQRPSPTPLVYSAKPTPTKTPTPSSTVSPSSTPTPSATASVQSTPGARTPIPTPFTTTTPTPNITPSHQPSTPSSTPTPQPTSSSTTTPTPSTSPSTTSTPTPSSTTTSSPTPTPSASTSSTGGCNGDPLACLLLGE